MAYQIKIHNFEGPFDLLFHLIEKAEVDIYDIPIAEITRQYLLFIQEMRNLDLEVASEFVVMAATLIQIKSKMLLPKETNPFDEIAIDELDPRMELIERLLEYKKYKDVSNILKEKEEKYINTLFKNAEIIDDVEEGALLVNITLQDIVQAFDDIVKRYNESRNFNIKLEEQVMQEECSVDDKIEYIKEFINKDKKIRFDQLFAIDSNKLEIIITFLALLELIRLRQVCVYQSKICGDIIVQGI